jgi:Zn-dependent metalloprotease
MSQKAARQAPDRAVMPAATVIRGEARHNSVADKAGRSVSLNFAPDLTPAALRLPSEIPGLEVKMSSRNNLPIFIGGIVQEANITTPNGRVDMQKAAFTYLNRFKDLLGISNPEAEFQVHGTQLDNLTQVHIRMQQTFRGVEVYGSQVILHTKNNLIQSLNGRYFPTPKLTDVKPAVSAEQAIRVATADVQNRTTVSELDAEQRQVLEYEKPTAKLVVYHLNDDANAARLAWHITMRPNFIEHWFYFVDAKTGQVLHQFDNTCSLDGPHTATAKDLNGADQTIHTYLSGTSYYMMNAGIPMFNAAASKFPKKPVGILWTMDINNTHGAQLKTSEITTPNNVWNNPTAVSASSNAMKAYEYYRTVHSRNGIDGKGSNVLSFINVPDKKGKPMDNAYWNGKGMYYGNGNKYCKPLAGALDVAGHEMTHGVIQHSGNMEYQGQSGALNESFADIFGTMIDREDWGLGEDIMVKEYAPTGLMRDLADPHNGGTSKGDRGYQPRVMSELYTGKEDNGGVHTNSGISNWAYYKFATVVGKDKAEKVYYRALTTYLTPKSQFADLRIAVVQAATDIHGATSAEVSAAKTAFDQVEIFEQGDGNNPPPTDIPTNPGQDYIVYYNTSTTSNVPNTFLVATPDAKTITPRTQTKAINRPSVTDNGDKAYYVSEDNKIRSVSLTGANKEEIVHDQAYWGNVAISKDGKRMAAVSMYADTSIYVFDLAKKEYAKFVLYNPTSIDSISTGDVRFADAIEWDYTGENLIYDAYNTIVKGAGDTLAYWDVGVIKVWDNAKNDFGDGSIDKIFNSLPDKVIGYDLKKGKLSTIYEGNKTIGYPTYSKLDDKLAFTDVTAAGDTVVNVVSLKEDKITSNGAVPTLLLQGAKWGVWYVQGDRKVLSSAKDITDFRFGGVTPAATGVINGSAITVAVPPNTNLKTLVATFTHSADANVKVGNKDQVSGATKNDFTNPVTYTVTAQDGTTKSYTVTVSKGVNTAVEGSNNISGKLTVFPNPTAGAFRVRLEEYAHKVATLELMNAAGTVLHQQQVQPQTLDAGLTLDAAGLPAGMYYLRLTVGEKIAYKKVMVH